MNTRKCSKCGWEYPMNWPGRTCRFCHTKFKDGYCVKCGKWVENMQAKDNYCTECRTKVHYANRDKHKRTAEERYKDWLDKIRKIPTPYKTLTEDDWLKACAHFGGCAFCGAESIDSRAMFITFKNGGRYCNWNIIPSCEKCETANKLIDNPFMRMNNVLNRDKTSSLAKRYGQSLATLAGIVDYLQQFMEDDDDKKTTSI